jgi:hypothetical protein
LKYLKLTFSIGVLAAVLAIGIPQVRAWGSAPCTVQCQCYQPNNGSYGIIQNGACPNCIECWIPLQ